MSSRAYALPELSVALPHADEVERSVLGGLLLDPSWIDRLASMLREEHFYREQHRLIWSAALHVHRHGGLDFLTLQARLQETGKIEAVGGVAYIARLDVELPDIGRMEGYAEILVDRFVRRRLVELAHNQAQSALRGDLAATEILGQQQAALLGLRQDRTRGYAHAARYAGDLEHVLAENPRPLAAGMSTGYRDLDELLHGLRPQQLVILAGRPSMGKTSLALNMTAALATSGYGVAWASLESSASELVARRLAIDTKVKSDRIWRATTTAEERGWLRQAATGLADDPWYIDDQGGITAEEIGARLRGLMSGEEPPRVLFVDHLQKIRSTHRLGSRNDELAVISDHLKTLAKELNICVVALSQLSRASAQRTEPRPILTDLRESGALEQDADSVVFIHRPGYYKPNDPALRGVCEVIVAKNRDGKLGLVNLHFDAENLVFTQATRRQEWH